MVVTAYMERTMCSRQPTRFAVVVPLILGAYGCTFAKAPLPMGPDPNQAFTGRTPRSGVAALLLPQDRSSFRVTKSADSMAGSACPMQMDFGPTLARVLSAEYLQLFERVVPTTNTTDALTADVVLIPSVTGFNWRIITPYKYGATVQVTLTAWKGGEKVWDQKFQHEGEADAPSNPHGCEVGDSVGKTTITSLQKAARSSAIALQASGVLASFEGQSLTRLATDPQAVQLYFSGMAFPHSGGGQETQQASDFTGMLVGLAAAGAATYAAGETGNPQLLALANSLAGNGHPALTGGDPESVLRMGQASAPVMTDAAIREHCDGTTTRTEDHINCVLKFQQLRAKGAALGAIAAPPQASATGPSSSTNLGGSAAASPDTGCVPLPPRCDSSSKKALAMLESFKATDGIRAGASQEYCAALIGREQNRACAVDFRKLGNHACAALAQAQSDAYDKALPQFEATIRASSESISGVPDSISGLRDKCSFE